MTQLVKTCMERNLHPCIVFSFSKRDCESYAMKLSKLDFNSGVCRCHTKEYVGEKKQSFVNISVLLNYFGPRAASA